MQCTLQHCLYQNSYLFTLLFKTLSINIQGITVGTLNLPIIDVQSVCLLRDFMYNYYSLWMCITSTLSFWRLNISVLNQILLKSTLHTDYKLQWWQQVHISTAANGMQLHNTKLQIIFGEHKHHCSLTLPPTSWPGLTTKLIHTLWSHISTTYWTTGSTVVGA